MAFVTWWRALRAVGTVAEATKIFRSVGRAPTATVETGDADFETGLANIVVAALKEAFDRDRSRLELDREVRDAEQARAERNLRLEWLRQVVGHSLNQLRLLSVLSVTVWVVSAVAAGFLAPLEPTVTVFLGLGWVTLAAAVTAAVVAHDRLTTWLATQPNQPVVSEAVLYSAPHVALPWLLLGGFVLTTTSLIIAL